MPMKYIETQVRTGRVINLSFRSTSKFNFGKGIAYATRLLRLKWQWRVVWLSAGNTVPSSKVFHSRREARQYKAIVPTVYKPRLQRRLVEVDWHEYNDSFGWNAGAGKR